MTRSNIKNMCVFGLIQCFALIGCAVQPLQINPESKFLSNGTNVKKNINPSSDIFEKAKIITGTNLYLQEQQEVMIVIDSGEYKNCHVIGNAVPMADFSRVEIKLSKMTCVANKFNNLFDVNVWKVFDIDTAYGINAKHIEPSLLEKSKYDNEIADKYKNIKDHGVDEQTLYDIKRLEKSKNGYLSLDKGTTVNILTLHKPTLINTVNNGDSKLLIYPKQ